MVSPPDTATFVPSDASLSFLDVSPFIAAQLRLSFPPSLIFQYIQYSVMTTDIVRSAWKIIPQFPSRSIQRTIKFYTEVLNFELGGFHPDDGIAEPTFCSVFIGKKAEANIYFDKCAPDDFHPAKAMIALGTTELDELYKCLQASTTVKIVEMIKDEPWGFRQFSIEDNEGNCLTFFNFLEGGNPGEE